MKEALRWLAVIPIHYVSMLLTNLLLALPFMYITYGTGIVYIPFFYSPASCRKKITT